MNCCTKLFEYPHSEDKDMRAELYGLLQNGEYPTYINKHIEKVESDGFIVESIYFNGPNFIFVEYGKNIGEISFVSKENWQSQMRVNFVHRESDLKYPLVFAFEKKI